MPSTLQLSRRSALAISSTSFLPLAVHAADPTRLVGILEEDPPLINPAVTSTISSYVAGSPVYSALTRMDVKGKITGDLAERWDMSADGLTYTFHLRKNVTWHDGTPFSADDVKFSLENINAKLHPLRAALNAIASVQAVPADNVVVLKLAHPQASLLAALHNFAGCILPKHLWSGVDVLKSPLNKQPVGTGPYKLVEYVPGDRIRYVKNERYFVPGEPGFDELVFRIMPDAAARVAAFEKGDVDVFYSSAIPTNEAARLGKLPGIGAKPGSITPGAYLAIFNLRKPPLSDARVRRALAHGIDRTSIRTNVMPGMSWNMVGPLPPTAPLANHELKDYEFDPAKANAMLDGAGYPYTALLLRSVPRAGVEQERLIAIEGYPPDPANWPKGCKFHPRCPHAMPVCREQEPAMEWHASRHGAKCWLALGGA